MIASDCPVTFGYGAVDGVYYGPKGSVGPYHRGEDRAMDQGTPVFVNGVKIGLSGTRYGGPHLHIGRFVNGKDTNPGGRGFTLESPAVVTEVSEDNVNGKFVRVQAEGASWVYLHLLEQTVQVGQELIGGNMPTISQEEYEDLKAWKSRGIDAQPYKDAVINSKANKDIQGNVNKVGPVLDDLWQFKNDNQGTSEPLTELRPGKYWVKG